MRRAPRGRSGDEAARPAPAPAATRFGLALFGCLMSVVGVLIFAAFERWWAAACFAVLAGAATVDAIVQARRMRRHGRQ
jgi:uncharacterized protein DUF6343